MSLLGSSLMAKQVKCIFTAVALVSAVAEVQCLARELSHATGAGLKFFFKCVGIAITIKT